MDWRRWQFTGVFHEGLNFAAAPKGAVRFDSGK